MKNVKAQATRKIREAMSGLQEAMKTASPTDRRALHACMSELRAIKADLDTSPSVEVEDEETPMAIVNEDESVDGDEELALSALELAASALKAAAEEDGEEAEQEETDEEASDEEAESEEEEEPAEEESEEEATDEEDEEESDDEEESEGGSDVDALTDEEIAALEAEGLLEGSASFKRARRPLVRKPQQKVRASVGNRLARVQARLNTLLATHGEDDMMEEELDESDSLDDGLSDMGDDAALLNEEDAELTPEEIAMLEEMGVGLEASSLILAASNILWAAKKRKKQTKSQKAASAKKWKDSKVVARSVAKRTKKGKFYVTVYRKKGNLTGNYNLFYKKKPIFKKMKAPSGASKAVAQRIAKHNMLSKAKVVKESPFAAKKAAAKKAAAKK